MSSSSRRSWLLVAVLVLIFLGFLAWMGGSSGPEPRQALPGPAPAGTAEPAGALAGRPGRQALAAPAVRLQVLRDGRPCEDLAWWALSSAGRILRGKTAAAGRLEIPDPEGAFLVLTAPGAVTLAGPVLATEPGVWKTVELGLSARLELRFHDEDRAPVEGIRATLRIEAEPSGRPPSPAVSDRFLRELLGVEVLPPAGIGTVEPREAPSEETLHLLRRSLDRLRAAGRTEGLLPQAGAALEGRSGPDGRILWADLPPGILLRWKPLGVPGLEPVPPPEDLESLRLSGGIPEPWSGPIRLAPGEHRVLDLLVSIRTGIRGRLDYEGFPPARLGRVILNRERLLPSGGGQTTRSLAPVSVLDRTEADGSFVFHGISPGNYEVAGMWPARDGSRCLVARRLVLREGEVRDLGLLSPGPHAIGLRFPLQSVEGLDLDPEEVFPEQPLLLDLVVARLDPPAGPEAEQHISEYLPVAAGEEFLLRGTPPGRWSFSAAVSEVGPALNRGWWPRMQDRGQEVELPVPGGVLEFPVLLQRMGGFRLALRLPETHRGPRPLRGTAWFHPLGGGGQPRKERIQLPAGADPEVQVDLAHGAWWFLVRVWEDRDGNPDGMGVPVAVGAGTVEIPQETWKRVDLEPGRNREGRAWGVSGEPLAAENLFLEYLPPGEGVAWARDIHYQVRTAADGSFRVEGLPSRGFLRAILPQSDAVDLSVPGPLEIRLSR